MKFLRDEAVLFGRKPDALRISNPVFQWIITESRAATRQTAEAMAPQFGVTPELLLQVPIGLIGTPEECIAELRRRVKDWGVAQFIFEADEKQMRRLKEEVLAHV